MPARSCGEAPMAALVLSQLPATKRPIGTSLVAENTQQRLSKVSLHTSCAFACAWAMRDCGGAATPAPTPPVAAEAPRGEEGVAPELTGMLLYGFIAAESLPRKARPGNAPQKHREYTGPTVLSAL